MLAPSVEVLDKSSEPGDANVLLGTCQARAFRIRVSPEVIRVKKIVLNTDFTYSNRLEGINEQYRKRNMSMEMRHPCL